VTLVAGSLNHTPILPRGDEIPTGLTRPDNQFSYHWSVDLDQQIDPALSKSLPHLAEVMTAIEIRVIHTIPNRAAYEGGVTDKRYPVIAGLRCNKGVADFLHTLPTQKSLRVLGSSQGLMGAPDGGLPIQLETNKSYKERGPPRGSQKLEKPDTDTRSYLYNFCTHNSILKKLYNLLLSHIYILFSPEVHCPPRAVLRLLLSAPLTVYK